MNNPIRVLCVFGCLDRGGAETMCMNLYRHIDRSKVQFDFVTHSSKPGAYDDEIRSLGGRIYVAPRFRGVNLLAYTAWWRKHLKQHPEHQIIHGHYFTISGIYFKIAHHLGRMTIGHSHSSSPNEQRNTLTTTIRRFILSEAEKESDYCFACSDAAGKWLYPHKKYVVLNNAINASDYVFDPVARDKVRNEFGIADGEHVVAVIGSLVQVKNPMGSLDIMERIHQIDPKCKLLWCGGGGMRPQIEERIRELELSDAVILAGIRPDIPIILQAADVYLMPSFYEGLPVSAVEAQAAGLPCVLSDRISRETAITDCCTFVPLEDMDAWVQAIEEGFRKGRSNTTQQIIDAGYDIHTTAKWLQDFYLKIAPKT